MQKSTNIKWQAIVLTAARLFEALVQLFIPIVLIRFISTEDFGMYRFLWLVVNSIMVLAPLGMPLSLLYFFPNLNIKEKSTYLLQTLIFLFISAIIFAFIFSSWNILLPTNIANLLSDNNVVIPVFIFLWIVTHALDFVPNALQKNIQQAVITLTLTVIRSSLIIFSAIYYGDLHSIILSLLIFVCIKYMILIFYIKINFDTDLSTLNIANFKKQFIYSFPFGMTSLVYALRKQAEQWIVAFLFSPSLFGAFSLATMVILPFDIIRSSISNVLMPKMSHVFAQGNTQLAIDYNRLFNLIVNVICFPLLVYIFSFCEDIVVILFGNEFSAASPVIRIYLIQLFLTLEVGNLMRVLEQGSAAFRYNTWVLFISIPLSYYLTTDFGLAGSATGGVVGGIIVLIIELFRISKIIRSNIYSLIYWFDTVFVLVLSCISIYIAITTYSFLNLKQNIYMQLGMIFIIHVFIYTTLLYISGEIKKIKILTLIGKS